VDLQPLLAGSEPARSAPLPRFPAAARELNVVVEDSEAAAAVIGTAAGAGGAILESVTAVDEYHGGQVGDGRKSVNLALTFRDAERTLTDAEVDAALDEIRSALKARHAAGFRT
jgi:phenylalanyl-tRNA synthetase beta chain